MTDSEFRTAWLNKDDNLRSITLETLGNFNLDDTTKDFLFTSGLPAEAAPFLSFVGDTHLSKYDSINLLTNWFDFLEREKYKKFIVIGSDGSGDIIAINSEDKYKVEWLDHEDYFSTRFMNTSLRHLALCLLAYRNFIQKINIETGENTYIESNFTDTQYKSLLDSIKQIDENAVKGGFWKNELEILIANKNN